MACMSAVVYHNVGSYQFEQRSNVVVCKHARRAVMFSKTRSAPILVPVTCDTEVRRLQTSQEYAFTSAYTGLLDKARFKSMPQPDSCGRSFMGFADIMTWLSAS